MAVSTCIADWRPTARNWCGPLTDYRFVAARRVGLVECPLWPTSRALPHLGASHDATSLAHADGVTVPSLHSLRVVLALLVALGLHGCAVVTVAGTVILVAATTVSITASAVETTVDVAAAGVDAVVGESDEEDTDDED